MNFLNLVFMGECNLPYTLSDKIVDQLKTSFVNNFLLEVRGPVILVQILNKLLIPIHKVYDKLEKLFPKL